MAWRDPKTRVEPLAWPTDVLERMVSGQTKAHELERLLPWAWKAERLARGRPLSMPECRNGRAATLAGNIQRARRLLPASRGPALHEGR